MLEVNKSEDRMAAARTRRLPEFKFNALGSQLLSSIDYKFEQGMFGNYPGVGPIPNTDTVISTPRRPTVVFVGQINQPLSQLYRIGLNLKQLGAGREIARQEMRAQRRALRIGQFDDRLSPDRSGFGERHPRQCLCLRRRSQSGDQRPGAARQSGQRNFGRGRRSSDEVLCQFSAGTGTEKPVADLGQLRPVR
jgi:hypothetical protein